MRFANAKAPYLFDGKDFISYDDEYDSAGSETETSIVLSNDDVGIEIDEFDTADFLELICKAGKKLEISGHIYDISDDEYSFTSEAGDDGFVNANENKKFNDELDAAAESEEMDENI